MILKLGMYLWDTMYKIFNVGETGQTLHLRVGKTGVGEMGVVEMGVGKTGIPLFGDSSSTKFI